MSAVLLLVSDHEPLAWVLTTNRYAIPSSRSASAPRSGTDAFIYTTRGRFRNPGRDRGRVIGVAGSQTMRSKSIGPSSSADERPLRRVGLRVRSLVTYGEGVDLSAHLGELDFLPDDRSWCVRLRRSVIRLPNTDVRTLRRLPKPNLRPVEQHRAAKHSPTNSRTPARTSQTIRMTCLRVRGDADQGTIRAQRFVENSEMLSLILYHFLCHGACRLDRRCVSAWSA